ncbi:MAG: hypothetical protein AABX48_01765 [Nanoarchaeota archaeon]
MYKHDKRAQAAMEFLMTYGWAILAAIIAIGVLAYFGVFTPGKYIPTATVLNPPFTGVGAVASAANGISIEIKNGLGETVNITSVAVSGCGTNSATGSITAGSSSVRTIACSPALAEGNTFKGDVTITYLKSGSSLQLTSTGTMTERVVA